MPPIEMSHSAVDVVHNAIHNSAGFFVNEDNVCICIPTWFSKQCMKLPPVCMETLHTFEEPIFLLYHPWGGNFHHNCMEILPNIFLYKEQLQRNPNVLLCVNIQMKRLYLDILTILDIPTSVLRTLTPNTNYATVYVPNGMSTHPAWNNSTLCKDHFDIFDTIRNYYCTKLGNELCSIRKRNIYITRRNTGCAGAKRSIVNNDEVENYMRQKNFECIDFTDMTMEEKFSASLHAHTIVSPVGANLVNLYFAKCDSIQHLILFDPVHKESKHWKYYTDQVKIMCKLDKEVKILPCDYTDYIGESNCPYSVDILELDKILVSFEI